MIISTARRSRHDAGLTLVEVMIAGGIGSFVMTGVLSVVLMMGRSGVAAANYADMEAQSRRAVDEFAQDVRMSSDLTWNTSSSITLTVPDNYTTTGNKVTYGYDNSTTGPTAGSFYRLPGTATSLASRFVLARNVTVLSFQ